MLSFMFVSMNCEFVFGHFENIHKLKPSAFGTLIVEETRVRN